MSDQQANKKIAWKPPRPWPTLHEAALYGIVGEIVRLIADQSEADPAAILITLLAGLGNIAGPIPRMTMGNAQHPARIFAVVAGKSNEGAKGTSYEDTRPFLNMVDSDFDSRTRSGFGSGEGIISEFSDQKEKDDEQSNTEAIPRDRRCFIVEEELSRIYTVAAREGSTLSEILRQAWGGGVLSIIRAKDRIIAHSVHISLIGHITPEELKLKLASIDMVNGFGNRFLYVCSKRSKVISRGGKPDLNRLKQLAEKIAGNIANVGERQFHFDDEAGAAWDAFCHAQKDSEGILDTLLARARPQCLRLAVAYALIDGLPVIRAAHIRAAIAVWDYSLVSADYLFGDLCEDRTQAGILDLLQAEHPGGCTIAELNRSLSNNLRGGAMSAALDALQDAERIRFEVEAPPKGGRPAKRFYAVPPTIKTIETIKGGDRSFLSFLSYPPRANEGKNLPPPPPNPPPFRPGVGMEIAPNGSTRPASEPEPKAVEEIDS
jgi:hypothetical protein